MADELDRQLDPLGSRLAIHQVEREFEGLASVLLDILVGQSLGHPHDHLVEPGVHGCITAPDDEPLVLFPDQVAGLVGAGDPKVMVGENDGGFGMILEVKGRGLERTCLLSVIGHDLETAAGGLEGGGQRFQPRAAVTVFLTVLQHQDRAIVREMELSGVFDHDLDHLACPRRRIP